MLDAAFLSEVLGNDLRRRGEFGMQNCQLVGEFTWKGAQKVLPAGVAFGVTRLLRFFRNSGNNGVTENLE